jgi:hypothetical protein
MQLARFSPLTHRCLPRNALLLELRRVRSPYSSSNLLSLPHGSRRAFSPPLNQMFRYRISPPFVVSVASRVPHKRKWPPPLTVKAVENGGTRQPNSAVRTASFRLNLYCGLCTEKFHGNGEPSPSLVTRICIAGSAELLVTGSCEAFIHVVYLK